MLPRQSQILHMIAREGKMEVTALSEALGVSLVTIRKDLTALEKSGMVRRQHGYAVLNAETDINNRLALRYETKADIARRACDIIEDGEVILLESGSCCSLLADQINTTRRNVTMITYSAFIANHVNLTNGNQIVLLGGTVVSESKNTIGPLAIAALENFSVGKFFSGTDGLTSQGDFTAKDMMVAQVIRAMSQRARETFVLTDSTKFSLQGTVTSFPASAVNTVFTDSGIAPDIRDLLTKRGVKVDTGEAKEG